MLNSIQYRFFVLKNLLEYQLLPLADARQLPVCSTFFPVWSVDREINPLGSQTTLHEKNKSQNYQTRHLFWIARPVAKCGKSLLFSSLRNLLYKAKKSGDQCNRSASRDDASYFTKEISRKGKTHLLERIGVEYGNYSQEGNRMLYQSKLFPASISASPSRKVA